MLFDGPLISTIRSEPMIRVLIARDLRTVELTSSRGLQLGPASGSFAQRRRTTASPVTIRRIGSAFIFTDGPGRALSWALPAMRVQCAGDAPLNVQTSEGKAAYPGSLVLVPTVDRLGQPTGGFDLVNHVPMETYLPGVMAGELFPNWHEQTYRAQAIAARSYALWEMQIGQGRHYDLHATVASQAYRGSTANSKAVGAVNATRGLVLAYHGRVVPAFYSSDSGGRGQDAAVAFPGRVRDIAPLRGRDQGLWGNIGTRHRWGPIVRDANSLVRRISAWGKAHRNPIAGLSSIAAVQIVATSSSGRPARFAIIDTSGTRFTLACESFRNACNRQVPGLPKLTLKHKVLSSDVQVLVRGGQVTFVNGRGFGHGVGLSQWGAQHMAMRGYDAPSILGFYYNSASIVQLY